MADSSFYICRGYHLVVYESLDYLQEVVRCAIMDYEEDFILTSADEARRIVQFWNNRFGPTTAFFSLPGELIFVATKEKAETPINEYWNVIVGEKIGWIYVEDWTKRQITPFV